jgi:Asp-tRNA(Asn)/Glu-tRNA(Gln) amidotransferase A subunit family amidase
MTGDDVRVLIDEPARRAEVSIAELAEALLRRLETRADLHAMITLTPELALAQAHAADAARARGCALPLDGMPLVIKATSASQAFRPPSAHGCSQIESPRRTPT